MRGWANCVTILFGVTACSTGRNSVESPPPKCAGPWLVTVTNNDQDDVEVFIPRGLRTVLGIVPPGNTREYLTAEPYVQAGPLSGGRTVYRKEKGVSIKSVVIRLACADKA